LSADPWGRRSVPISEQTAAAATACMRVTMVVAFFPTFTAQSRCGVGCRPVDPSHSVVKITARHGGLL